MSMAILIRLAMLALLAVFLVQPEVFAPFFALFTTRGAPPIYVQSDLLSLALNHMAIVVTAVLGATVIAVGLAVLVTRPNWSEFLPLSRALANIGQTFPPIAVLALAVPAMGFGNGPTLVALFLYGLLPIFENTMTGLSNLPPTVQEAARGMGMSDRQRLWQVELPLAMPVILGGVRLSTVIAISTATIGSTVAARTLGEVIIAGLLSNNIAFILQGGLVVGAIAVLVHDGFVALERRMSRRAGQG
ncbi:ABC transporter permease [Paracoccus sp. Z330]|uniref:ABC transporter permease n=1 Tax=Paracoccus onchidii TaxID=3017813 RepID=A0ABT4ZA92_9RHOB|nr:ABC transporter permease [Paracoccus onchidii]MDB6176278.1 ABC transporter permease [Paracoccus onchidii]